MKIEFTVKIKEVINGKGFMQKPQKEIAESSSQLIKCQRKQILEQLSVRNYILNICPQISRGRKRGMGNTFLCELWRKHQY